MGDDGEKEMEGGRARKEGRQGGVVTRARLESQLRETNG